LPEGEGPVGAEVGGPHRLDGQHARQHQQPQHAESGQNGRAYVAPGGRQQHAGRHGRREGDDGDDDAGAEGQDDTDDPHQQAWADIRPEEPPAAGERRYDPCVLEHQGAGGPLQHDVEHRGYGDEREEHNQADEDGSHHAHAPDVAVVGGADDDGHDHDGDQYRHDDQCDEAHEKPHPEETPEACRTPVPRSAEPGFGTPRRGIVHAGDQSGGGYDGYDEQDETEDEQSRKERAYERPVGLSPALQVGDRPERILAGAG
jgi:hypothetical protein